MARKKIGERLVERGKLSPADLELALQDQRGKTLLLGDLLLRRGSVSKEDLAVTLQELLGIDYVDCGRIDVDPAILKLVPLAVATQNAALPLRREGKKLALVMANPQDLDAQDQLRFRSGMDISPRLGFRGDILAAIERLYKGSHRSASTEDDAKGGKSGGRAAAVARSSEELMHDIVTVGTENGEGIQFETSKGNLTSSAAAQELASANQQTPAVRIFSSLVGTALREGASDIHIDPQPDGAIVRIRVDGILRDIMDVPSEIQASLISRIKILAEMDIAERRAPQDGRVKVRTSTSNFDLRISTLPTQHGEKAVVRLSNPNGTKVSFMDLGFSPASSEMLRRILMQPQGMLLVTGPTGSGKTTTLYSALNQMRTRTKNIITVEDPIEYMLEGINQVQVNIKAGRTFANCLRSILRQDPNVIMVGEIRDQETAEIALSSSQTGHMVLSTLHTNDSVSAIVRLLDLNVPAFLIASSVSAVIAQRLVRRLCACCGETPLAPDYAALLASAGVPDFGPTMYVRGGCPACKETGYKGRLAIYEILVINELIRNAIRAEGSPDEIRRMARIGGMRLLQEEGLERARTGETSLEELFRVVPFEGLMVAPRCAACGRGVAPAFPFCPHCGADRRAAAKEQQHPHRAVSVMPQHAEA